MAVSQNDIFIQGPQGHPIAVIEVKNRQNLSRNIATDFRRNMLAHGLLSQTPYFLLTSQDTGFLWKQAKAENLDALPDYEFPMQNVILRYARQNSKERLHGPVLELIIFQWLLDLTMDTHRPLEEPEKTLAQSGFNDSIKGAKIITGEIE